MSAEEQVFRLVLLLVMSLGVTLGCILLLGAVGYVVNLYRR